MKKPDFDPSGKDDLLACANANRHEFTVGAHPCFLLEPHTRSPAHKPWVWYAPTFIPRLPKALHHFYLSHLLDAGIHVAGIDAGESWGNPTGRTAFSRFHEHMTSHLGMESRACLLAQSRGGLMHYNWAAENPAKVKCIAGIYPMTTAFGPLEDRVYEAHGLSQAGFRKAMDRHNPIDRIRPLARAGVPVYHLHGNADTMVPYQANAVDFIERYRTAAGTPEIATLQTVPHQGHEEIPEFFISQPFLEWLLSESTRAPS